MSSNFHAHAISLHLPKKLRRITVNAIKFVAQKIVEVNKPLSIEKGEEDEKEKYPLRLCVTKQRKPH